MTGVHGGDYRMLRLKTFLAGLTTAATLVAGTARAATWLLDYASTGGSPQVADLTLSTSDVLNAVGGFDVTGISGLVDGDTVTGLISNPGQPFANYSADGMFRFDNVLWSVGAPVLSNPGLFFHGASGNEYNLFSDNAATYELYRAQSGVGYLANSLGSVQISRVVLPPLDGGYRGAAGGLGVPEPNTWAMMIIGFGAVGAALRLRRRATRFA